MRRATVAAGPLAGTWYWQFRYGTADAGARRSRRRCCSSSAVTTTWTCGTPPGSVTAVSSPSMPLPRSATGGCPACSPGLSLASRSLNRTAVARSMRPAPPPPPAPAGWTVTGTKTWISRLTEAAIFCVFFTDPVGRLTAAAVDAASDGLDRTPVIPAGLSGWAWDELHLDAVHVRHCDLLGEPGEGMQLLKDHFARYRPLVAATALGAAAGVHDQVSAHLEQRRQAGAIASLRDNALIILGRTYAGINAALLSVITAQRLAETGDPSAHLWGSVVKAHGVDVAYQAASELTLLAGAAGFAADSRTAKACRDLNALLYADGIHDSLYRSAGRSLASSGQAAKVRIPRLPAARDRVPAPRHADQVAGTPFSSAATAPSATA